MTQLADILSMGEDRPYRPRLTRKNIEENLPKFLQDEEVLNCILPVFQVSSTDELRNILLEETLKTFDDIEPLMNFNLDSESIKKIIFEGIVREDNQPEFDLFSLIHDVWGRHWREFDELYEFELNRLDKIEIGREVLEVALDS